MHAPRTFAGLILLLTAAVAPDAGAQSFDNMGTRAQGMGGAFVAVADDASAVFWNPAGLARGSYFSLVFEGNTASAVPDFEPQGVSRSASFLALTTPALGLTYYRSSKTVASPPPVANTQTLVLDALVTHHVGATLVQSLTDALAVGATVKVIRGYAGSAAVVAVDAEEALDDWDIAGRSGTAFDVDLGVMASGSMGRLGLTVRNLTEPDFETGSGTSLMLDRQIRGGGAIRLLERWMLAADVDFTRYAGAFGDVREVALGTEGQVTRRLAARAGLRLNTVGNRGRTPAVSAGGSFAVVGSILLDAQITGGSDGAFSGWGVAGRIVF